MNKNHVRDSMLKLTAAELEHATQHYLRFLEGTKLVPTEPIESDEQAQARFQADLTESLEQPIHTAEEKLKALLAIDFGPKKTVGLGAVVCVDGKHFVIGIATNLFRCESVEMMGLSPAAPFYSAIEGLSQGDAATFRGRSIRIRAVY